MKKHVHLAGCLLSSMLFHVNAMQQELPNHGPSTNAVQAQDADRAMAELCALTHDDNPAATRRLCGSRNCGSVNCGCTPKNNCCTKLQCRRIISTLDVVESKVCLLTECEPIPLSPNDIVSGTLTIDQPGSYCLCCDITANITISASQVTLDLNCHQVTGQLSVSNQEDIFLTNGIIDANNAASRAIMLVSCTNVQLSELTVRNAIAIGIFATGATGLFVSNLLVEDNGSSGFAVQSTEDAFIADSVFRSNGFVGLRFGSLASHNAVVTNCQAISNKSRGFSLLSGSQNINFYNCIASQNSGDGFAAEDPNRDNRFNAFDCVSDDNGGNGFNTGPGPEGVFYFKRCLAKNNNNNGFISTEGTSGTISQCIALNNGQHGFNDTAGSSLLYISNYAQDNTLGDYIPAAGAPFNPFSATAAGISFWYNTFN